MEKPQIVKRTSLNDIATMLGVSKATISRALNGGPGVSSELRKKILETANELGYQLNTASSGHASKREKMLALILRDLRNPLYSELAINLQHALRQEGYSLMVLNSDYSPEMELENIRLVSQFNLSGLFLITINPPGVEKLLQSLDLPIVFLNRMLSVGRSNSVLFDNYQAGYLATLHLADLRHQRIGFIFGSDKPPASQQRYLGFSQAAINFSIDVPKEYLMECDLTITGGEEAGKRFLSSLAPRPSAMVISNDIAAIGFMNVLKQAGVRIPEDLSIISFDNTPISSSSGIELTTIDRHVEETSQTAVRLMLKQLHDPSAEPEKPIIMPTLVIRKTTAPYNA